jgi:hypothetical protein
MLNGGCGEVVSELDEAVCDCCNLFSLKNRSAESAGEDIWMAKDH